MAEGRFASLYNFSDACEIFMPVNCSLHCLSLSEDMQSSAFTPPAFIKHMLRAQPGEHLGHALKEQLGAYVKTRCSG